MKVALSKKEIRTLVYFNVDPELGFNWIKFETDLRKLFK